MFGNQNQEQKSCFDFVLLEPVPRLICTHGGFLFDTGYEGRHGLVPKEVSPAIVICTH